MSLFPFSSFDHCFAMWNETDPARIRGHLAKAVAPDFEFCDPIHMHVSHDGLEANVQAFRARYPTARVWPSSAIDHHHNRLRYSWEIRIGQDLVMVGLDCATMADSGLIQRIDGFFGLLAPLPSVEASRSR